MDSTEIQQAISLTIKAKDEEQKFTQACRVREMQLTEDIDGYKSIFNNVLSQTPCIQLSSGGYLYMKERVSVKAPTIERINTAVDALDEEQLKMTWKELQNEAGTAFADAIGICVHENLEEECIKVNYQPSITKRRPENMKHNAGAHMAPQGVDDAARRFIKATEELKCIRAYKNKGRRRCKEMIKKSEPIIKAFLDESGTDRQRVQFVNDTDELESSNTNSLLKDLPELPTFTQEEPVGSTQHSHVVVCVDVNPQIVEFKKKVYKSKGKAPKLDAFTEGLGSLIEKQHGRRIKSSTIQWWISPEGKEKLKEILILRYKELFEKQKGEQVEKLIITKRKH